MNNPPSPTPEQVKLIYRDTYIFYTKYATSEKIDYQSMLDELRSIEQNTHLRYVGKCYVK
jgi:hypothetical protein